MHEDHYSGGAEIVEEKEEREEKMKEKILSLPTNKKNIHKMILEYFFEQAHFDAITAFMKETPARAIFAPLVREREELRKLSSRGEFLSVMEKISSLIPFFFTDHPTVYFQIMKQEILEDMYVRKSPEAQIILRMEKELSPIVEKHPSLLTSLEELVGVVLFRRSTQEKVISSRNDLFQEINREILLLLDYEINDSLKHFLEEIDELSKSPSLVALSKDCVQIEELLRRAQE